MCTGPGRSHFSDCHPLAECGSGDLPWRSVLYTLITRHMCSNHSDLVTCLRQEDGGSQARHASSGPSLACWSCRGALEGWPSPQDYDVSRRVHDCESEYCGCGSKLSNAAARAAMSYIQQSIWSLHSHAGTRSSECRSTKVSGCVGRAVAVPYQAYRAASLHEPTESEQDEMEENLSDQISGMSFGQQLGIYKARCASPEGVSCPVAESTNAAASAQTPKPKIPSLLVPLQCNPMSLKCRTQDAQEALRPPC